MRLLLFAALLCLISCSTPMHITEANSPKPLIKGKKHMLVPGNAYKIRKPKTTNYQPSTND